MIIRRFFMRDGMGDHHESLAPDISVLPRLSDKSDAGTLALKNSKQD